MFPRADFPVSRYNRATVWSKFYLQLPGLDKPTRINVHRYWRNELDALAAAFPAESIGLAVGDTPAGEAAVG